MGPEGQENMLYLNVTETYFEVIVIGRQPRSLLGGRNKFNDEILRTVRKLKFWSILILNILSLFGYI